MAASAASGGGRVWIPVDVKVHWFSFLSAPDLASVSRVCKSWTSLATKTCDAEITRITCATNLALPRGGKLRFLHRLQHAHEPTNMGYLLTWAAGCREYTPFLHKLLLLRDALREELGLPAGIHEPARPDAYDELDDDSRALWTYRLPAPANSLNALMHPGGAPGVDVTPMPPLLMAASRGNVDAVHLLLLFGEGVHGRRKGNERALYVAAEQGNLQVLAALLGRVPLRPPRHPPHVAQRLGLFRPVYSVMAPGRAYQSGVQFGPRNVAGCISAAKSRAELAAATGFATQAGPRASAAAVAARSGVGLPGSSNANAYGGVSGDRSRGAAPTDAGISPAEITVSQLEHFENDGRYRSWCRGYHMGRYWSLYDESLAAYEAIHGTLGVHNAAAFASGTPPSPAARSAAARRRSLLTLDNVASWLSVSMNPGSIDTCTAAAPCRGRAFRLPSAMTGLTPAYVTLQLLVSRLPPNHVLVLAARPQPKGRIHPRIPVCVDYGAVAADFIATRVRLNAGPSEGRTPLLIACERGRTEIAFLLLSHFRPAQAASGEVPEPPRRDDAPATEAAGGVAAAPPGNGAAPPVGAPGAPANAPAAPAAAAGAQPGGGAAPPPPPSPEAAAAAAAAAALSAIASASSLALAVPAEVLTSLHEERRHEAVSELLREQRDQVDVDACPSGYHTPLCLACERGDDRLAALLLHWGADVNKQGRKEAPPLLVAAMCGHDHVVRLLLRIRCAPDIARAVMAAVDDVTRARDTETLMNGVGAEDALSSPVGDADEDAPEAPATAADTRQVLSLLGITDASAAAATLLGRNVTKRGDSSTGGSVIASQTRRRRAARDARRPEDPVVDACEPTVVTALLLTSPGDELSSGSSSIHSGMFLPPEEAVVPSHGHGFRLGAGVTAAFRRTGALPQRAPSFNTILGLRGATAAQYPEDEAARDSNVEALLSQATAATFTQLVAAGEALRTTQRLAINALVSKSRVCSGVGCLPVHAAINVDLCDESGYTALFIAASTGKHESVAVLVAAGADATLATKRGKTPIYGAVEKCHVDIVDMLLPQYSAPQLRANTTYGTNVLHAANKSGNNRIKDLLNRYCVEWDAREAKKIKREGLGVRVAGDPTRMVSHEEELQRQEAYMKRMMSGGGAHADDPLAAPAVSSQIERLRRLAEDARRKQDELESRRLARERLHAVYGGAADDEESRGARRGRSVAPSKSARAGEETAHGAPAPARARSTAAPGERGRGHSAPTSKASVPGTAAETSDTAASGSAAAEARHLASEIEHRLQHIMSVSDDVDARDAGKVDDLARPERSGPAAVAPASASHAASRPAFVTVQHNLVRHAVVPRPARLLSSPLNVEETAELPPVSARPSSASRKLADEATSGTRPQSTVSSVTEIEARPMTGDTDSARPHAHAVAAWGASLSTGRSSDSKLDDADSGEVRGSSAAPASSSAAGSSVFERLAARAKEMERKRAEAIAEYERALKMQAAPKTTTVVKHAMPPSAVPKPRRSLVRADSASAAQDGKLRPGRNRSVSAGARRDPSSADGKLEDVDAHDSGREEAKLTEPAAPASAWAPPTTEAEPDSRPTSRGSRYSASGAAAVRALAREEVAQASAPAVASELSSWSADAVRAQRLAFYNAAKQQAGPTQLAQPPAAVTTTPAGHITGSEPSAAVSDSRRSATEVKPAPATLSLTGPSSPLHDGTRDVSPLRSPPRLPRTAGSSAATSPAAVAVPAAPVVRKGVYEDAELEANIARLRQLVRAEAAGARSPQRDAAPAAVAAVSGSDKPKDPFSAMFGGVDAWQTSVKAAANAPAAPDTSSIASAGLPAGSYKSALSSAWRTSALGAPRAADGQRETASSEPSPGSLPDSRSTASKAPSKARHVFADPALASVGSFAPLSAAVVATSQRRPSGSKPAPAASAPVARSGGQPDDASLPRASSFRLSPEEEQRRDERNRMRELQRALRVALHKEEQERREREERRAAALSAPTAATSLALAAAAYGVSKRKL